MFLFHCTHKGAFLLDLAGERRRFQRLLVTLPVEYIAVLPESGECYRGQGVLKDFSLSGIYFHTLEPVPLQPGHIILLTITTPFAPLNHLDSCHIQVHATVVRLENPPTENGCQGVAVAFLEYPTFLNNQNPTNNC
jgi:hypothetical protein|uniref:PilZ domain-containing protein n=1 Tax=Desulfobacca acetoxidans TaxID=60893 RepID=A0A7C3V3S4_9BACT